MDAKLTLFWLLEAQLTREQISKIKRMNKCDNSMSLLNILKSAFTNGTLLHDLISVRCSLPLIQLVLSYGVDVKSRNKEGLSALSLAIISESEIDIVESLLDAGGDFKSVEHNYTPPLHDAAAQNLPTTVQMLLKRGANIEQADEFGSRPLHHAASFGSFESAKFLIEKGANIDARNHGGRTPLHHAAESHQHEIVRLLLEAGANACIETNEGKPPIQFWQRFESTIDFDMVIMLRKYELFRNPDSCSKFNLDNLFNLVYVNPEPDYNYTVDEFEDYEQEYKKELCSMKGTIVGTETLYSLCFSKNVNYFANEELIGRIKTELETNYPHYGSLLERKISTDMARYSLIRSFRISWIRLRIARPFQKLQPELSDKIADYLGNRDLSNFIQAFGEN